MTDGQSIPLGKAIVIQREGRRRVAVIGATGRAAAAAGPPTEASRRRRRAHPEVRRADLIDAALESFSQHGVAGTSVDDIVSAANVAKGTFYLYFESKDAIVDAVAARMVEGVGDAVESAAGDVALGAVARLRTLAAMMAEVGRSPHERDLVEIFHRPENRVVHDRMGEQIAQRLGPALEAIVADGIADGSFRNQDPRRAAAFVLGSFSRIHDVVDRVDDAPAVLAELDAFVLRGLGYTGKIDA
jgi:AcrR family transcriptional regulator